MARQPMDFIPPDRRQMREREKQLRYSTPETQQTLSLMPLLRQGAYCPAARQVPDQVHDELHVGPSLPLSGQSIGAALFQDVFVGSEK
jgi:hypothetical protein